MATLSTCCWSPKTLWSTKLVTRVGSYAGADGLRSGTLCWWELGCSFCSDCSSYRWMRLYQKSFINSWYDPVLNTNTIWRSLPQACSEHPQPMLPPPSQHVLQAWAVWIWWCRNEDISFNIVSGHVFKLACVRFLSWHTVTIDCDFLKACWIFFLVVMTETVL